MVRPRNDIDALKEIILEKINNGIPRNRICQELKCKPVTLNTRLRAWGVTDLSTTYRSGKDHNGWRPAAYYLNTAAHITSSDLKEKLIKEGYKQHQCEHCGRTDWIGYPDKTTSTKIPLELDHINGNRYDNNLENLQLLCPNCHSLTPTHCTKNQVRYVADPSGLSKLQPTYPKKIKKTKKTKPKVEPKPKKIKTCVDCNAQIGKASKRCRSCAEKHGKINWPDNETLQYLVWEHSFVSLSKILGVSDTAIRNRCANRSISAPPQGYWRCLETGMTKEQAIARLKK